MKKYLEEKVNLLHDTKQKIEKLENLIEEGKSGILFILGISISLSTNVFTGIFMGSIQHTLDTDSTVRNIIFTISFLAFMGISLFGYHFIVSQWIKPIKKLDRQVSEALKKLKE